jgi:DNA-binding transcriptional LysR family regulator
MLVICAPDYPLAGMKAVAPKALLEYEFISREPGSGTRAITEAYFRAQQIPPEALKTQMELGSPESLKGVVATGLGFAIVSRAAVDKEIRLGSLAAIALKPALKRSLHLIYPQDRFQSRLAATFIEFARKKLKESAA